MNIQKKVRSVGLKEKSFWLWINIIVFAGSSFVALMVFAATRKVTIPLDKNSGINLLNGSAATVTYNVICHTTGGSTVFTSNGLTLTTKASTNFSNPATCSGGAGSV